MPTLNLAIGAMTLEGDDSAKKDTVLAHLYNGYRVGNTIFGIPGYSPFCDLEIGNVPIDGDYYSTLHGARLVVAGGRCWKIGQNGTKIELSGVSVTPGVPVVFAEDSTAVYFVAASYINKYSPGSFTITQLTGQAPRNNRTIAYISGFLLTDGQDATGAGVPGDIWYSDSSGYLEWEVFNNESVPDALQAVFVTYSEVYAIGRESIEVNYLSGDVANPFAVNKAASQPFGTPAPYSVAFDKQSIYYLTVVGGVRRIARLIGGREPQIVSFAVDVPVDDIYDVSNARAWMQSWRGQTFYVITFPTANITIHDQVHDSLTLAFNLKAQEWYIWGEWFPQQGQYGRYPADTFLYIEPWSRRFVGYNGVIYEISGHDFNGGIIRPAIRTGWRSWGEMSRQKVSHQYTYDIKRGVGSSTEDASMLHRWRDNGNAEWRLPRSISLGQLGQRTRPKFSYRCGMYYERQDEFIFPDNVETVFNGVEEDISVTK